MSILEIDPKGTIKAALGEEIAYTLSAVKELGGNTIVSPVVMTVADSDGGDVTVNFSGGTSNSAGIITFGLKGYAAGVYTVTFWVTCNETLPDGTPDQFVAEIILVVK